MVTELLLDVSRTSHSPLEELPNLQIVDFNTRAVLGQVKNYNDREIADSIESAKRRSSRWKGMKPEDRFEVLRYAGEVLRLDRNLDAPIARAGLCSQKVVREDRLTTADWLINSEDYAKHFLNGRSAEGRVISTGVIVQSSMYQTGAYGIIEPLRAGSAVVVKLDSTEPFSEYQIANALSESGAPVEMVAASIRERPHVGKIILDGTDKFVFMGNPHSLTEIAHHATLKDLERLGASKTAIEDFVSHAPAPQNAVSYSAHSALSYVHEDADIASAVRHILYGAESHYRACKKTGLVVAHPHVHDEVLGSLITEFSKQKVAHASDPDADIVTVNDKFWDRFVRPHIQEGMNFGEVVHGGDLNNPTIIALDRSKISENPQDAGRYISSECMFPVVNVASGDQQPLVKMISMATPYLPNHRFLEASIFTQTPDFYNQLAKQVPVYGIHWNQPTTWGLGIPSQKQFRTHEGKALFLELLK